MTNDHQYQYWALTKFCPHSEMINYDVIWYIHIQVGKLIVS